MLTADAMHYLIRSAKPGIIYEISNETTGDLEWVDEDAYQFWYNNLFGDEPPLDIPWKTLDEFVHPNG